MLSRPSLLQHRFEVKLSLAESLCSAVRKLRPGETRPWLKARQPFVAKPVSKASTVLSAKEQPCLACEESHQAETKLILPTSILQVGKSTFQNPLTLEISGCIVYYKHTNHYLCIPCTQLNTHVIMSPKVTVVLQFSLLHFTCLDCRREKLRKWLMNTQIRPGGTLDRMTKLMMLNLAGARRGWVGKRPFAIR